MRVEGKVCIVTGAARGIGEAIGMRLAAEGASVVFADINAEEAEGAAAKCREQGGKAISAQVDVTKRDQVKAMIDKTVAEFGKLDVMFNNAGVNKPQDFLETTEENWNFIMTINGLGVLIGIQEAAKQMIKQGSGGKIVNTASVGGRQGFDNIAPYCASKFAVISLTQSGARDLAKHGITVNGFSPGVVDTPMWKEVDKDLMELGVSEKPGQAMEDFSATILLGRPATPDEIAGMALFLASADSDYITGQILPIDGGQILV
jgi:meso-butanediol dehydrogenase/(S,S)-butanediol dehydrogenase/diacetyl reductase